jgi:hypothetical protein
MSRLMILRFGNALLTMLGLLTTAVSGQRDPIKDFCRRFGHQTAVIEYLQQRRLYIDGGLLNWDLHLYQANYTSKRYLRVSGRDAS